MVGLRKERGGQECRDRVCACHVWGYFVVSLTREAMEWEHGWVRGTRGVCLLVAAAAKGSFVLNFLFALRLVHPGAFLT